MLENKHRTAELYGFLPCEGTTILVIVFNLLDFAGRTYIVLILLGFLVSVRSLEISTTWGLDLMRTSLL